MHLNILDPARQQLLRSMIEMPELSRFYLAGGTALIDDIAIMKWGVIGNRCSRKDFYDLYQIFQLVPEFDSARLWKNAHRKYGAISPVQHDHGFELL